MTMRNEFQTPYEFQAPMEGPMQPDTRKLLTTGSAIFFTGVVAAVSMLTVFGGVTRQGPHSTGGWLALMLAMGCLPTGTLTLLLAGTKLIGDKHR
jgi:hypothetical protein